MTEKSLNKPIGANVVEGGVEFRVWVEAAEKVSVVLFEGKEEGISHPLSHEQDGYFSGKVAGAGAGTRYMFRLNQDKLRPDPASRFQPEGVHGPSEVVNPDTFQWQDRDWKGIPLRNLVIYEVHIGTATPQGTFEAFIEKLDYLKNLGITAVEILPVADFPGERNWGYDGVCLFAPSRAYGGPEGLRKLVDSAHQRGLAVLQDVVYNHFGPDGNYLRDFSRQYFTEKEQTPWGDALNYSDQPVRDFFISNALGWLHEYHMDGLRLDATHTILDPSPVHILREIVERIHASLPEGRNFVTIAEDERNEVKLITRLEDGGTGLDAVWADDFHHQVRSAFAGDNEGYFADFSGSAVDLAKTLQQGWFFNGQLSNFKKKHRGTDASAFDPSHFVYCIQNHDQIGNRAIGDRLNTGIEPDGFRAASSLLLLSPHLPLLFQGQEWAASSPFLFFTDHNPDLGKLVTEGRRAEFAHFSGFSGQEVPDPQAVSTFEASKLKWDEIKQPEHSQILELYRDLLSLRRELAYIHDYKGCNFSVQPTGTDALTLFFQAGDKPEKAMVVVNLKGSLSLPVEAQYELVFTSNSQKYGGPDNLADLKTAAAKGSLSVSQPAALVFRSRQT